MRNVFGRKIAELGAIDDKIVVINGDFGWGILDEFKKNFPTRYFNVGICEQTMIGVAAGMALMGYKPYVYTITPFLIERPFEQIKIDIDNQKLNVKLIGYAAYTDQGITHQELNGPVLMSLFKSIKSYFPRSNLEVEKALIDSYLDSSPTFISLVASDDKK